jgi:hypothetical protein
VLAYISQAKLYLWNSGRVSAVESEFARSVRERTISIQRRNAWKTQGRGGQLMGAVVQGQGTECRIAITGVAGGRSPRELLYSLESDDVSGIFGLEDNVEQRLFHTADFRVRQITMEPGGNSVAASIVNTNLSANIAIIQIGGTEFIEATEGDSFDLSPRWARGGGRRIVFQSAGVGRDTAGRFCGLGAFCIQELDLASGSLECLAESKDFDFLAPQKGADGSLYYVRRPHENTKRQVSALGALKDAAMFPFRMGHALVQYCNMFSMVYTGKPLITAKGAAQRPTDPRQLLIHGNLVSAERAAREGALGEADAPALVPSSWELVRQAPGGGSSVLARGVLSYDLAEDGSIVYTNGSAIYRLDAGGHSERLLVGDLIEQVAILTPAQ